MISRIQMTNLRGKTRAIGIDSRNILISGEMGAGKSTVIEALQLALLLPTRHGSRNLGELSPSGSWSVTIDLAGRDDVRSLTRSYRGKKQTYAVNANDVSRDDYEAAVRRVTTVEPHHIDLSQFLNLSGQKRADMFSSLLESTDLFGIDEPLRDGRNISFDQYLTSQMGEGLREQADRLKLAFGDEHTPADWVDLIKQKGLDARRSRDDASTNLDTISQRTTTVGGGENGEEIQRRISELDQKIGVLRQTTQNVDTAIEQHEAAMAHHDGVQKSAEEASEALKRAQQLAHAVESRYQDMRNADANHQLVVDRINKARADLEQERQKCSQVGEELARLQQADKLVSSLLEKQWNVDRDWMDEQAQELICNLDCAVERRHHGVSEFVNDEDHERLVAFAREVFAEAMGGAPEKVREAIKEVQASRDQINASIQEALSKIRADEQLLPELETAKKKAADLHKEAVEAANSLEELEMKHKELDARRATALQNAQRLAPADSVDAATTELDALQEDRKQLEERLRDFNSAKAISGQVEEATRNVTIATKVCDVLKDLLSIVQEWRDKLLADRIAAVVGPFDSAFKLFWGDNASLVHRSGGTGRSTRFDFYVRSGPYEVPLDMLSDGETVLAAVAFLAALQKIDDVDRGRMILLNSEGLSSRGLDVLLANVPKLEMGLDLVMITNNRGQELSAIPEGWQRINL
jgi:DNA repair exonuclease SbcCD ATPase subunit